MEKNYTKVSLKSTFINHYVKFFSKKNIYKKRDLTKKFVENYKSKTNKIVNKLAMKKDSNFSIPVYTYNGTLQEPKSQILLYLHGGSYIEEADILQYQFAIKLAEQTDSTLIVPLYTIAPKGNYKKAIDDIMEIWFELLKINKVINIFGDSAGGGLSLTTSMVLRDKGIEGPKNILLLSPWLDLKLDNPDIKELEKKDTMSGIEGNQYAGELWANGLELDNFLVSPLYGDFKALGLITIASGEYDIMKPDCILLKDTLKKENYNYNYFEYKGQIHDFGFLPTKEGENLLDEFVKIINNKDS